MMPMMPYKITTQHYWPNELKNIRSWLSDNIGEPYSDWITDVVDGMVCVKFVREADAIAFALRWR